MAAPAYYSSSYSKVGTCLSYKARENPLFMINNNFYIYIILIEILN